MTTCYYRFSKIVILITFLSCLWFPCAKAQSILNAYPTGAEGIRPANIPPPGNYTKLYNLFYTSDDLRGVHGNSIDPNFDAFTYLGAIRHFWISDFKILGADYGMDFAFTYVQNDLRFSTPAGVDRRSSSGLGDTLFQPLLLGWHGENWDAAFLYGMFIPTGDFDPANPASVGAGHWTHLIGYGGNWYPDPDKTWSISFSNRFEFHGRNDESNITSGVHFSAEWGISKKFPDFWEIGAVGTITQKISDDTGSGVYYDQSTHDRVYSAGVEITKIFPESGVQGSLRWFHEFEAEARPQGNAIWFSLTKFW
jgi:hypothetical protein